MRHRFAHHVRSVLSKILLCRTPVLKERRYRCPQCDYRSVVYNSCTDRNCPECSGARRRDWLDGTSQLVLPGVNYFQVVFTLPDKLSPLVLGNRRELYNLLFLAAWRALNHFLRRNGKFQPAALMVLHTWNQRLEHHPHIHAVAPGGGPALEGDEWMTSKHPDPSYRKPYLVNVEELGRVFQRRFMYGLRRLVRQGELKLEGEWSKLHDPAELKRWCQELQTTDWNVYVEGPQHGQSKPAHVLKYLTRYLTGGPIGDTRILRDEDGWVQFLARSKDKGRPQRVEPVELRGTEFVRRWALHILPKGFIRSRRYGGYHTTKSQAYLQRCRELLPPDTVKIEEEPKTPPAGERTEPECPHCHVPLESISKTPRPSWKQVFEIEVYRSAAIYCPLLHLLRSRPP
ncbi:Putative transposase [Aureliella helgolandensis]|uniref:Transposase n=2 Tax=Aureliella helgolandensis TaxID=2527968 RepID=A0A518G3E4_9BACT|nr:transposase [Aureliella helgolandensis]QDV23080.1 Putative transposase [Aureliella helgolandensis]